MKSNIGFLGKSKAVEILIHLNNSPKGVNFNSIKRELETDPKTITRRLKELADMGLVKKSPQKIEVIYNITEKGKTVLSSINKILEEIDG